MSSYFIYIAGTPVRIRRVAGNDCSNSADGETRAVPDVFIFVECQGGVPTEKHCPDGEVFIAEEQKCRQVTNSDESQFCKNRTVGNHRNPWDCKGYLACPDGAVAPTRMPCPANLNYNPSTDQCEWPDLMSCKIVSNVAQPTPAPPNKCSGKSDGLYVLGDVFKYLECNNSQVVIHECAAGEIYIPEFKTCQTVTIAYKEKFCNNRNNGNYRHPWDCSKFYSCSNDTENEILCPNNLMYHPDTDQCDQFDDNKCKTIQANSAPSRK